MDVTEPSMFCLDCGYPLDGLAEHRCPECGLAFDPDDMDSYSHDVGELVRIYQGTDQVGPHALHALLRENGIPATIMSGHLRPALGYDLPGTQPSVWVGEKHLQRAEPIVREFLQRPSPPATDPAAAPPTSPPWTCANCGEEIEPQFDACWNCGAGKDDVPG